MEENIALDSQKQKKFVKSLKGIKKLIKKNVDDDESKGKNEEEQKPQKPFSMRLKKGKVKKRIRKERGLVYLAHIPHGFYEHQMTQYFRQFGVVTNVRVIRSKRTGNSKGYAFVEFKETAVGEIVAETMNNYLMGKRLIKAAYIPPDKQKRAFRKRWNTTHNPASVARLKIKKAYNADKDDCGELNRAKKYLKNLNKTKKRLSEMGINYDFFLPVDIPEALLDQFVKQEKEVEVKDEDKKKAKKAEKSDETVNKTTKNTKVKTDTSKKSDNKKVLAVEKVPTKVNKKEKVPDKVNKQEQKDKKQKLKVAGVKPVEEFIKVQEESGDSDSSYDFDSDEYDKVLEQDDDDLSSGGSEESENDDGETDDEDEEESEEEVTQKQVKGTQIVPVKQAKGKPPVVPKTTQPPQTKKQTKLQEVTKQLPQEFKRKAAQKFQGSPKKPKFEKQNQKPLKKQFKKK